MFTIVDYNVGNAGSIKNMLDRLGYECLISSHPKDILQATKLILPGVGKFDVAMRNLDSLGLIRPLTEMVIERRTPILGICLGMQLFGEDSEEGHLSGLGWIKAHTSKFRFDPETNARIPHMGWNEIDVAQPSAILDNRFDVSRFYFVHSYHVCCDNSDNVLAATNYGIRFHSAIMCDNIYGTQFHPEKSHKYGLRLMKNFAEV